MQVNAEILICMFAFSNFVTNGINFWNGYWKAGQYSFKPYYTMKTVSTITIVLLITIAKTFAQDIINFNDGKQQVAHILEVRTHDVVYKLAANPNGPIYTTSKADLYSLVYENGYREVYGNAVNSAYYNQTASTQGASYTYQVPVDVTPQPVQVVKVVQVPVVFPVSIGVGCSNRGFVKHRRPRCPRGW